MRIFPCLAALFVAAASPVSAQNAPTSLLERLGPLAPPSGGTPVLGGQDCAGGIVYDDGSFENGYTGDPILVTEAAWVQLIESPPATLDSACVCFTRLPGVPAVDLDFDLVVLDDDGAANAPSTPLASIPAVAAAVPEFPAVAFYRVDSLNLPTDGAVYVGASWNVPDFPDVFLCSDESATTPLQPAFARFDGGAWQTVDVLFQDYSALGIRAEILGGPTPPLVPTLGDAGLVLLVLGLAAVGLLVLRASRSGP